MSNKQLIDDLRGLMQPHAKEGLPAVGKKGAKPGAKVNVPYVPKQGGGIASPLVEQDAREHHQEKVITSVDGLLSFIVKPIKSTLFIDANGEREERQYVEPDTD